MDFTDKLLKCIVCQKQLDTAVKNQCAKGHIHCQECANTLDGTCGLCELPVEPHEKKMPIELLTTNEDEAHDYEQEYWDLAVENDQQEIAAVKSLPMAKAAKEMEIAASEPFPMALAAEERGLAAETQQQEKAAVEALSTAPAAKEMEKTVEAKLQQIAAAEQFPMALAAAESGIAVQTQPQEKAAEEALPMAPAAKEMEIAAEAKRREIAVAAPFPIEQAAKVMEKVVETKQQEVQTAESLAIVQLSAELDAAMYETLKTLHQTMCQQKCETFELCLQNLLMRVIEENAGTTKAAINTQIRGTESITDLLETLHVKLCQKNCNSVEECLNKQLQKIIRNYIKVASEECPRTKTPYAKDQSQNNFYDATASSNVVRAIFQRNVLANKLKPQFEYATTFPKSFESSKQTSDMELHNATHLKPKPDELFEPFMCPVPKCQTKFDVMNTLAHIQELHKELSIDLLEAGECKTFFIDPSILARDETDCLFCYFLPATLESGIRQIDLPIFLMVCRTSLRRLYSVTECLNTAESMEETDSFAAADDDDEVDEAIYGANCKMKRNTVVWSCDEVLIVWPMAPVQPTMKLKTVLSAFVSNKPKCHRSISFHMRSMKHSREALSVFGAPEALTLTNVEIDALTSGGQHAIQCQIVCNF